MKKIKIYRSAKRCLFVLISLFVLVGLCVQLTGKTGIVDDKPDVIDIAPEVIYYDYVDDKGVLKGGAIKVYADNPHHSKYRGPEQIYRDSYPSYNVETIIDNGPVENRIDIVVLGDGYTEPNLGLYADDVNDVIDSFFSESPLDEYASYFNVHRVDVISIDSGVKHGYEEGCDDTYDPCTALEMSFCTPYGDEIMERLLVINDYGAASSAANQAPDNDTIMALANSTKYGGSGGMYTCLAARNELAVELALHEVGHSFAKLGDEYFDPNGVEYTGLEPSAANLCKFYATDMNDEPTKWYRWLDWGPEPKDVWTFEGAAIYYNEGIYRPTEWSMMRHLDYPFYQVNVEQFIFKIYEIVYPIDNATPPGTYPVSTVFFVEPLQPATHNLDVQWYLDDDPIQGATATTFDASSLELSPGTYTLSVDVVDNTDMVRDEGLRMELMSETREWTLVLNDSSHLNDTSKFYVKNASGENVAWLGNLGNIVLRGTFTSGETIDTAPDDSFIIKDATDDTVAYIDNQGNLCIEGSKSSGSCNPSGGAFITNNIYDDIVSYIDYDGDLCLTGTLIEYSNP